MGGRDGRRRWAAGMGGRDRRRRWVAQGRGRRRWVAGTGGGGGWHGRAAEVGVRWVAGTGVPRQCAPSTAWVERGVGTHPAACRGAPRRRDRRLSPGPRAVAALPGRLPPHWRRRPSCRAQLWRCRCVVAPRAAQDGAAAAQCHPRTRADRSTRCAARRARDCRGRSAPARRRRAAARYRSCAVERSKNVGSEGLSGSKATASRWDQRCWALVGLSSRGQPQAFRFSLMTS